MGRGGLLPFVLLACAGCGGGSFEPFTLLAGGTTPDADLYHGTPAAQVQPASADGVDLRHLLPPVGFQSLNDCVGWSIGYYLKTAIEAKEHGWNPKEPANWFSPAFLYHQRPERGPVPPEETCRDRDGAQGCMDPTDALRLLVRQGCCRWSSMRPGGEGTSLPSKAAIAEALEYRATEVRRFGTLFWLTDADVDDMRGWLQHEGTPIAVLVDITEGWALYDGSDGGVCLDPVGTGSLGGGHMMTVVGYDDDIPVPASGSFLVVNSWGPVWGADGTMWIPYEALKDIWQVGYGVQDGPSGPPAPGPDTELDNVIGGASPLYPGQTVRGHTGPPDLDPADWYVLTLGAGQTARLTLTGLSDDLGLLLTTARETVLEESTNFFDSDEEIEFTSPRGGTYYVKVRPWDLPTSLADAESDYTLAFVLE